MQFFPQDPSKVMISCADSQVRILQGVNLISKFKGKLSLSLSVSHASVLTNLLANQNKRIMTGSELF